MTFFTQESRVGAMVLHPPGFLFMFSGNVQAVGDVSICRGRVSRPVFPNLHRVSIYTIPVALSSWRTTGGVCEKLAGRETRPLPCQETLCIIISANNRRRCGESAGDLGGRALPYQGTFPKPCVRPCRTPTILPAGTALFNHGANRAVPSLFIIHSSLFIIH